MIAFYAYLPNHDGTEPVGTDRRILFQLKTRRGGIRRAIRLLGVNVVVKIYQNFYDDSTFYQIFPRP